MNLRQMSFDKFLAFLLVTCCAMVSFNCAQRENSDDIIALVVQASEEPNLALTTDESNEWNIQTIGADVVLGNPPERNPLVFFDDMNGIAAYGFAIQLTSDGGRTWNNSFSKEGAVIKSLVPKDKYIWAVGLVDTSKEAYETKPIIFMGNSRGANFKEIEFDTRDRGRLNSRFNHFLDICFDPKGNGWIAGDGGVVQVTFSQTSAKVIGFFPGKERFRISCSESGTIWALGVHGVFRYINAWKKVRFEKKYFFSDVKTIGEHVWLLGSSDPPYHSDGIALVSGDNGKSWENRTPFGAELVNDLFLSVGSGWLVGNGGNIYRTFDDGSSWIKSKVPIKHDLVNIFSLDRNNAWISGEDDLILRFKASH